MLAYSIKISMYIFHGIFEITLIVYGLALVGALVAEPVSEAPWPRRAKWTRLLLLPRAIHFFVRMNWAQARGFVRFVLGRQRATWERTARAFEAVGDAADSGERE